jgi:ABC-type transport system substrate-binding protein
MPRQEFNDEVLLKMNFKGVIYPRNSVGTDVDYWLSRSFHSKGQNSTYTDAKVDELVDAQRTALDPNKRAEILKEFQRHLATKFYVVPPLGRWGAFTFQWNWLHNSNQPVHLQWLDPTTPRRNG